MGSHPLPDLLPHRVLTAPELVARALAAREWAHEHRERAMRYPDSAVFYTGRYRTAMMHARQWMRAAQLARGRRAWP